MLNLSYVLKGREVNTGAVQEKQRIYFTCHPKDFQWYFEEIIEDIFKSQDCVILFNPDMESEISEEDMEMELGQMQLFVIPVTKNLLFMDNRARQVELEFAKKKHIPVLPLVQEAGLEEQFSRVFGNIQFLNKHAMDITMISYKEKMKKFLDTVIIGNKLQEKIRQEFDAYIFLSYRKIDRKYANKLMRLIHKNNLFSDIAIWYDEYLVPGEDFNDAIALAMKKSDMFAFAVTPNLLEEDNYVMNIEYPEAKKTGKPILPVELVKTDKEKLFQYYRDIPDTINPDVEELSEYILQKFRNIALAERNNPEHIYLIGLAYLNGIDMEVNTKKAVELITKAAEMEWLEAMEKLVSIYEDGISVRINYPKAIEWQKKVIKSYIKRYGKEERKTLMQMQILGRLYDVNGNHEKNRKLRSEVWELSKKVLGEKDFDTLTAMNNLACTYNELEQNKKALDIQLKVLKLRKEVLGEKHSDTLGAMHNLSFWF